MCRILPASGQGWKSQIGLHVLDGNGSAVCAPCWPQVQPSCLAASRIDDRIFLGEMQGAIYSVSPSQRDEAPALLFQHPDAGADFLECSADGRYLLSLGSRRLCAWNLASRALSWQCFGVHCFSIDPDSQRVVCGMKDGQIVELHVESGSVRQSIRPPDWPIWKLAISRAGRRMVCVGDYGQLQVFTWPEAKLLWRDIDFPCHAVAARIASFSPSGRLLIIPSQQDVRNLTIRCVETGQRLGELRGHTKAVTGAEFVDDRRLVSWGTDGAIRVWDVERKQLLDTDSLSVSTPSEVGGPCGRFDQLMHRHAVALPVAAMLGSR